MNFNIEKIMEIYGDSTADLISENVDDILFDDITEESDLFDENGKEAEKR